MSAPRVSVVIASWNTREMTLACVEEIDARLTEELGSDGHEILVVDNGSDDGTAEALAELASGRGDRVRCLALGRNRGFAAAINRGLEEARAESLLLLNSDAALEGGAASRCLATLNSDPCIAAVGPQLVHSDGRLQNSIHAFPSLWTELLPIGLLEWLFPARFPSKRRPPERPVDVDALLGASFFVRRTAIDTVGPLPEEYFFFLEETAWCWRMRVAGLRVVFEPRARAVHRSGASSKTRLPEETAIEYERSLDRFLVDHRGSGVAAVVRVVRTLRAAWSTLALSLRSAFSERAAQRLRGRRAALGWMLAGRPDDRGLRSPASTRGPERGTLSPQAAPARTTAALEDSTGESRRSRTQT